MDTLKASLISSDTLTTSQSALAAISPIELDNRSRNTSSSAG